MAYQRRRNGDLGYYLMISAQIILEVVISHIGNEVFENVLSKKI